MIRLGGRPSSCPRPTFPRPASISTRRWARRWRPPKPVPAGGHHPARAARGALHPQHHQHRQCAGQATRPASMFAWWTARTARAASTSCPARCASAWRRAGHHRDPRGPARCGGGNKHRRCRCRALTWPSWNACPDSLEPKLRAIPGLTDLDSQPQTQQAHLRVEVKRDAAADQGFSVGSLASALRTLLAGRPWATGAPATRRPTTSSCAWHPNSRDSAAGPQGPALVSWARRPTAAPARGAPRPGGRAARKHGTPTRSTGVTSTAKWITPTPLAARWRGVGRHPRVLDGNIACRPATACVLAARPRTCGELCLRHSAPWPWRSSSST
jgi:hypothetical protein